LQQDVAAWKKTRSDTIARVKQEPGLEAKMYVKVNPVEKHIMQAVIRNGVFTITADEPSRRGGEDRFPSMMEYFLAGLAMTQCAQILWNAAELDMPVTSIELDLSGAFPLSGWAGIKPMRGLSKVYYVVRIESPAAKNLVRKVARRAYSRCPAVNSLLNPVHVTGTVICNGEKIAKLG
jgi:uncharacterized OsmC-like protein